MNKIGLKMAFVLSFVPHKSTKTPQNKRFMAKHSFFTGQNSTFANAKQCSAKDLIGSKVFLDIIFSGFVPFLSRMINSGERQKLEVIENKRVTIEEIGRNAVTTSNHQKDMRFTYVKTIYLCHRRHIWAKALIGAYEAQTSTTYPSVVHQ